jgi:hypothetical protein
MRPQLAMVGVISVILTLFGCASRTPLAFEREQAQPLPVKTVSALSSSISRTPVMFARTSERILIGQVLERHSSGVVRPRANATARPFEVMLVRVERTLKGKPAEFAKIRMNTGVADGMRVVQDDVAQLQPGKRYLFFLKELSRWVGPAGAVYAAQGVAPTKIAELDELLPAGPAGVVELVNGRTQVPRDPWHVSDADKGTEGLFNVSEEADLVEQVSREATQWNAGRAFRDAKRMAWIKAHPEIIRERRAKWLARMAASKR